ncbi:MAG TPA: hypothetical protein DEE98_07455 [Elusimicrobia bacterium]|nr:hypothetical protein [Elusimicrobiota bacterium]
MSVISCHFAYRYAAVIKPELINHKSKTESIAAYTAVFLIKSGAQKKFVSDIYFNARAGVPGVIQYSVKIP